jgi:TetR/AcrR family transcriptional regulator, regulator of autoinduction and epiphytic fitness
MQQPNVSSPNPRHPDRQLSPEKTAAILTGAMQEFLARGYAAASMDRISAAAGVSKATVYSHFRDKQALFNALIEQLVEKKFRTIFGSTDMQVLQGHPQTVLRQLAERTIDAGANDRQFLDFMRLIVGESGRFPELARTFVRNIEVTTFKALVEYLKTCPKDLRLSDTEATARIFVGALVHYTIVQELLHGADILPMERDRLIDSLIVAIVR